MLQVRCGAVEMIMLDEVIRLATRQMGVVAVDREWLKGYRANPPKG